MIGSLTLTEVVCYKCQTHFAMDIELYNRRLDDGYSFWCPNGHSQAFMETTVSKLKKQNENLKKRAEWAESSAIRAREQAESARRSKAAIKGQLTRVRKRIANGVCPCCNRTFADLYRHIETKHPDFKEAVT